MGSDDLIQFEYAPLVCFWNLPHLPMRITDESVELKKCGPFALMCKVATAGASACARAMSVTIDVDAYE